MIEVLERELIYLWYYFSIQFEQIFGYWALGTVIGSVISVFGKERIAQLFNALQSRRLGVFGLVPSSLIGIASPLCMYGTVPIAAAFSEKGMRDDWLAAFMMSSILLNPQLIIYSAALGTRALVVRIVSCVLGGIVAGLCVRFFYTRKDRAFFNFTNFTGPESRDTDPSPIMRLLKNIWRNIKVTGPYFLIGVALSAVFQRYVPESAMVALFGNRYFGVFMAATIGVPLYVCGGGTIPLLQQWLASGMSLGQATAFMIVGPATKITNLGAVKIILGVKRFIIYILFSVALSIIFGIAVDLILSTS